MARRTERRVERVVVPERPALPECKTPHPDVERRVAAYRDQAAAGVPLALPAGPGATAPAARAPAAAEHSPRAKDASKRQREKAVMLRTCRGAFRLTAAEADALAGELVVAAAMARAAGLFGGDA